jgi:secondary thiamine-phosphate synthase enzyme
MTLHKIIEISTNERESFVDITSQIKKAIADITSGSGILLISSPHTTGAITINENADPDVTRDMTKFLNRLIPNEKYFRHAEGNSDAHIKTALVGTSTQIPFIDGKIILGMWQGIYFCEFDGPRRRNVHITLNT